MRHEPPAARARACCQRSASATLLTISSISSTFLCIPFPLYTISSVYHLLCTPFPRGRLYYFLDGAVWVQSQDELKQGSLTVYRSEGDPERLLAALEKVAERPCEKRLHFTLSRLQEAGLLGTVEPPAKEEEGEENMEKMGKTEKTEIQLPLPTEEKAAGGMVPCLFNEGKRNRLTALELLKHVENSLNECEAHGVTMVELVGHVAVQPSAVSLARRTQDARIPMHASHTRAVVCRAHAYRVLDGAHRGASSTATPFTRVIHPRLHPPNVTGVLLDALARAAVTRGGL